MVPSRQVRFQGFDPQDKVSIGRRRLPHWRQAGVIYFVTFRLADSLPQTLLHQWQDERANWMRWHPQPWLEAEQHEYEKRFNHRMQEWLDAGMGACHLRRPDVRGEVERCLLRFDGTRCDVDCFVVMPNHVHTLIAPSESHDLTTLLRGIKGASSNRCNKILGRKGQFWMDESYDHIVRSQEELQAHRNYILENSKKASLKPHEYSLQLRNILVA